MSPSPPLPSRPQPAWDRRTRPVSQRLPVPGAPTPAREPELPARPAPEPRTTLALAVLAVALAACTGPGTRETAAADLAQGMRVQSHAEADDLLTAGLGEAGLRSPVPPAFADALSPTAQELRRRAIWSNWRGIADLSPGSGYGSAYGSLARVPGREYHAFATLPGRQQPHRLMVQLPDAFDPDRRCVVVTASSGSRGVYGAIALAGAWGLPRGCAVAYTDKGAGTGFVDTASGQGTALDGRPAAAGEVVEFRVPAHAGDGIAPVAVKHAHSGDNPEADWGLHVRQAADFALQVLDRARPGEAPWTHANTRVIAVGVSNGGGAVLRAAGLPGDWMDAAVAVSPNILPRDGGRALYDYATEAAIWMPCALNAAAFDTVALARPGGAKSPAGTARCAALTAGGELQGDTAQSQAEAARAHLLAQGWTDAAITAGALSTAFDLWRAVDVTYASSYAGTGPGDMPCGYSLAAVDAAGAPRAPTATERAAWWSDASGIPPSAGVGILDTLAAGDDRALPGLRCLRALWDGRDARVRTAIEATRADLPRAGLPLVVIHGIDDGLVPEAFSGAAYAAWLRANGRELTYLRHPKAQHFDAFVALPALSGQYQPLLPQAYRALDEVWRQLQATPAH
ncbi:3-hydroxybutyrate oligomer hydrolase family protein [Arenimonas sp. MALMAid1274]|uniref:3-hydroxybutyrate oligomer hydrolase family protein n=1 Tax=Arenimonas sp. MALMAid1274 TaxID=3411630 RepID=UPI003BA10E1A